MFRVITCLTLALLFPVRANAIDCRKYFSIWNGPAVQVEKTETDPGSHEKNKNKRAAKKRERSNRSARDSIRYRMERKAQRLKMSDEHSLTPASPPPDPLTAH